MIILGLQSRNPSLPKDTTNNIRQSGEFVVHLVDRPLAEAMNVCAIDFPDEISEFDVACITRASCRHVKVSRIKEAPIAFECRRTLMLKINENRDLAIGEIIYMHARDGLNDPKTMQLNLSKYGIIGRLFGDLYTPIVETFAHARLNHSEWLEKSST
ncbi:MAG TPA: flavin reductase family protein [Candidatus Lambdaproteobacteria bacterium]|nr:flavin reductase family protein [Candidatus Lambdaproteobacteria bacterium]HIO71703.1 flavin reductase family protein [Flavobacteriales bacterium]